MAEKDGKNNVLDRQEQSEQLEQLEPPGEPPYSIFPKWKRVLCVYVASLAAFASPVSSSIYYPAMLTLARDLNTSLTNISLTITTYMVLIFYFHHIVQSKADDSRADFPRYCTNNHRRTFRSNGTPTSLLPLLHVVHRRQYRARLTDKLRCIAHPTLRAKLRQQRNNSPVERHRLRRCYTPTARQLHWPRGTRKLDGSRTGALDRWPAESILGVESNILVLDHLRRCDAACICALHA